MALPFVLGLVIGGGAVYAYNNREKLSKQVKAKSKELKAGLKKGQETFDKVSTSIKNGAKNLTTSLKSSVSTFQSTKSAKSSGANSTKTSTKVVKQDKGATLASSPSTM